MVPACACESRVGVVGGGFRNGCGSQTPHNKNGKESNTRTVDREEDEPPRRRDAERGRVRDVVYDAAGGGDERQAS